MTGMPVIQCCPLTRSTAAGPLGMMALTFTSGSPWTGLSPDRLGVKPALVEVDTHARKGTTGLETKES